MSTTPTTEQILDERQKTHGDYSEHAALTQSTIRYWQGGRNWRRLSDMQKETLHMIAHKVGRILSGDPDVVDHYADIAGYATLIVRALEKKEAKLVPGTPEDGGHHAQQKAVTSEQIEEACRKDWVSWDTLSEPVRSRLRENKRILLEMLD